MEPKKILALVEKFRKDDERIEICELKYSEFQAFIEAYPDMKGVHFCDKWLIVTSPSDYHEIIKVKSNEYLIRPLETVDPELEGSGQANEDFEEVRCPDDSLIHLSQEYPKIVVEVSFTNQSYYVFRQYLKNYLDLSHHTIKYAIGIFARLTPNDVFRLEVIQVSYEDEEYVENIFPLGNDPDGINASSSPQIMTIDRKYISPEKDFNHETQFVNIDLKNFRSKLLAALMTRRNFHKNKTSFLK